MAKRGNLRPKVSLMEVLHEPYRFKFHNKYEPQESGCCIWSGGRDKDGYGFFYVRRRTFRAHHAAYVLAHRRLVPKGMSVLHTCDNPACVNSEHLWLGTQADNMRDMVAKGRSLKGDLNPICKDPSVLQRGDDHWSRRNPEKVSRGARHGNTKLNWDKVREIRALRATGHKLKDIAKRFGIDHTNVGIICRNKSWVRFNAAK